MVDIYCKIFKTKQLKIGYDKNFQLRLKDIYEAINKNTSLLILANPNSPTGTLIKKDDLMRLLKKQKDMVQKYSWMRLIMNFQLIIFHQK